MNPYLPHTEQEIKEMLSVIGVTSLDDLFADIPPSVRLQRQLDLKAGMSEYEVALRLRALAEKNSAGTVSFLGGGCYDQLIPSTVKHLISRSEFYTAYTPYQAEISQGVLQAIFEFQTMICELTGMDVSNASLYDGHTAACEAAVIALNSVRKADTILYSQTVHPFTKQVLHTYFKGTGIQLQEIAQQEGAPSLADLEDKLVPRVAGVIVQSPNFFGCLENYSALVEAVHANNSLLVISSNPISLGVLKSQGEWGADLAVGDTQPCGLPATFGGPSVGYIAARRSLLRKMPGRIVGQSLDKDQRRAYLLTLQAREQHIKRERATSNICSNQALAALATTVYLATLGRQGLKQLSLLNAQKAHYLYNRLTGELSLKPLYRAPFFNEFSVRLPGDPAALLSRMEEEGIFAGLELASFYPESAQSAQSAQSAEYADVITVAVTEKRTRQDLDRYVDAMKRILS
jgi:glycine dehydrogenase subunit 1